MKRKLVSTTRPVEAVTSAQQRAHVEAYVRRHLRRGRVLEGFHVTGVFSRYCTLQEFGNKRFMYVRDMCRSKPSVCGCPRPGEWDDDSGNEPGPMRHMRVPNCGLRHQPTHRIVALGALEKVQAYVLVTQLLESYKALPVAVCGIVGAYLRPVPLVAPHGSPWYEPDCLMGLSDCNDSDDGDRQCTCKYCF
jgi:hypothetical protein